MFLFGKPSELKQDPSRESLVSGDRGDAEMPPITPRGTLGRRESALQLRSSFFDSSRDQILLAICLAATSFAMASVCLVLILSCLGRVPLIEPDVRLLNWDKVWKAEIGGMAAEGAAGWEEIRRSGVIDIDSLGSGHFEGPPKIAFMFLVRGPMPLIPVWERFLNGSETRASIYIHASWDGYNVSEDLYPSSIFFDRQIPGVEVEWGGLGMVRAERDLIAAALEDPANQRFVLLSESCIPVRSFQYVQEYLFSTNRSFITNHRTDWRYPGRRMPSIPRSKFRKGSQWVVLNRRHAELVNLDHQYFAAFAETSADIPDESYIQTLVPMLDPENVEPRTVSFLQWPSIFARHPTTFQGHQVTAELVRAIQTSVNPPEETVNIWWSMSRSPPCELNGRQSPCFLFARKFKKDSLLNLLQLSEHLGY